MVIKLFETFSGIGSQAKALKNIGMKFNLFANVDWDVGAIISYDLIHNGKQDLTKYKDLSKEEIILKLEKYQISMDGKVPYDKSKLKLINRNLAIRVLCAIENCNNLVSITDIKGQDIPEDIDIFTYSFPCQDLSLAGIFHGEKLGIDRGANNRSGMLWEVERILKEMVSLNKKLPKFLLMENVKNLTAPRHNGNFKEWQDYLSKIGYYNKIYTLNASNFGIPQDRVRIYMISIFVGNGIDKLTKEEFIKKYFEKYNLENKDYVKTILKSEKTLQDILKVNYSIEKYKKEADSNQQNNTPSRKEIYYNNIKLYNKKGKYLNLSKTLTTKQDRNPNSGIIEYDNKNSTKADYRTLTPRECFLLMGFEEKDIDILLENDFKITKNRNFFTNSRLFKLAGNSIVVNVLEAIFKQIKDLNESV